MSIDARIRHKRDTSAEWTRVDPLILDGELILVDTSAGELRAKIGDGVKKYTQLPFIDEHILTLITNLEEALKDTIVGFRVSGTTVTYIKADGTEGSFTTQDKDTTYSTGTSSKSGLTKLYTETGTATDGAMTQKAVTELYDGLSAIAKSGNYNDLTDTPTNTISEIPVTSETSTITIPDLSDTVYVGVYHNGILINAGTHYTISGTTLTLVGYKAEVGDIISIVHTKLNNIVNVSERGA